MRTSAFVPSHITGFFEVHWDRTIAKTGSRGVGVVIDKGAYTTVEVGGIEGLDVFIDGRPCSCPTTKATVRYMLPTNKRGITVSHDLDVPMKYGLGISGAGALGTALALNQLLSLNLTRNQCGEVAHRAEVANKTGLGDVIAELEGGLVIRTEPGAPGVGRTDKIPCEDYVVIFLVGGEMETKSILRDPAAVKRISRLGRECLRLFLKKPTVENFMKLSKEFAVRSGLMSKKVYSVVRQLELKDIISSMAMLGNTVFTITDDPEKVAEEVEYMSIISKVDIEGARVL
jgi:pantoate kinase